MSSYSSPLRPLGGEAMMLSPSRGNTQRNTPDTSLCAGNSPRLRSNALSLLSAFSQDTKPEKSSGPVEENRSCTSHTTLQQFQGCAPPASPRQLRHLSVTDENVRVGSPLKNIVSPRRRRSSKTCDREFSAGRVTRSHTSFSKSPCKLTVCIPNDNCKSPVKSDVETGAAWLRDSMQKSGDSLGAPQTRCCSRDSETGWDKHSADMQPETHSEQQQVDFVQVDLQPDFVRTSNHTPLAQSPRPASASPRISRRSPFRVRHGRFIHGRSSQERKHRKLALSAVGFLGGVCGGDENRTARSNRLRAHSRVHLSADKDVFSDVFDPPRNADNCDVSLEVLASTLLIDDREGVTTPPASPVSLSNSVSTPPMYLGEGILHSPLAGLNKSAAVSNSPGSSPLLSSRSTPPTSPQTHLADITRRFELSKHREGVCNSRESALCADWSGDLTGFEAMSNTSTVALSPMLVLECPGLVDDYYYNVLDWSLHNQVAIALESACYVYDYHKESVNAFCDYSQTSQQDARLITSLSWSPQGQHLAVGLDDGIVQILEATTKQCVYTFQRSSNQRVAVSRWFGSGIPGHAHTSRDRKSNLLATGSKCGELSVHDIRIARKSAAVNIGDGHSAEICGIAWKPHDQPVLASGGNDNSVLIWDIRRPNTPTLSLSHAHTGAVKALSWSPSQSHVLSTGGGLHDRKLKFWNINSGVCMSQTDAGGQVSGIHWSKNFCKRCVRHAQRHTSYRSQRNTQSPRSSTASPQSSSPSLHSQRYNQWYANHYQPTIQAPDRNTTALSTAQVVACTGSNVVLYNGMGGQVCRRLNGHSERVLHSCMSPLGDIVCTAGADSSLRFWRTFPEVCAHPDRHLRGGRSRARDESESKQSSSNTGAPNTSVLSQSATGHTPRRSKKSKRRIKQLLRKTRMLERGSNASWGAAVIR